MRESDSDKTPHTNYIRWVPRPRTVLFISRIHVWIYRMSGGLLGSRLDRLDHLLLTTVGRRSGKQRTTPLPYFRVGPAYVVVASFGGSQRQPAWLLNLVAFSGVQVQIGRERFRMHARVAQREERQRLWALVNASQPRYLDYQARSQREIPVVVLEFAD